MIPNFILFFKAQHQPPFLKHTEKAPTSSVEVKNVLRIFEPGPSLSRIPHWGRCSNTYYIRLTYHILASLQ